MNKKKNRHRRPLEVFVVVLIAVVAVVVYLIRAALIFNNLGVLENGIPEGLFQGYTLSETGGQIAFGFFYIFVSFAALVIAIGLLWMRRWSWVAFMVWAGFNMVIGLLRLLYGAPKSNYLYLFLSVVVVFILNQAEVQRVFGIHYEELEDLEDVE
jgi:hypothetical protein